MRPLQVPGRRHQLHMKAHAPGRCPQAIVDKVFSGAATAQAGDLARRPWLPRQAAGCPDSIKADTDTLTYKGWALRAVAEDDHKPLRTAATSLIEPRESQEAERMRAVHKVLVVDDDPVIARSFDRVLSTKGYAVITVENGADALKRLAAEDYDVVYADIRMPGMSGLEMAEQVKAQRPWTPVVIITGYGSAEHEARAKAAGVAAFLNKPLSPDMIEDSAVAALRKAGTAALQETAPAEPRKGSLGTVRTLVSAALGGLAFMIAFPVVALASLVWLAMRERGRH